MGSGLGKSSEELFKHRIKSRRQIHYSYVVCILSTYDLHCYSKELDWKGVNGKHGLCSLLHSTLLYDRNRCFACCYGIRIDLRNFSYVFIDVFKLKVLDEVVGRLVVISSQI